MSQENSELKDEIKDLVKQIKKDIDRVEEDSLQCYLQKELDRICDGDLDLDEKMSQLLSLQAEAEEYGFGFDAVGDQSIEDYFDASDGNDSWDD
jgi:hypothetical protein